jgi:hypothetical protein
MKTPDRRPCSDEDLDALLGSRLRDTTPEFEARWVDLKRRLRPAPPARRAIPPWAAWLGLLSAGVTVAAILLALHPWRPAPPRPVPAALTPALDELLSMDATLESATALLDGENRDALLHLPVNPTRHT